jgi:hypothetical protein
VDPQVVDDDEQLALGASHQPAHVRSATCRSRPATATCSSSWSDSDRHIEQSPPRHIERVRVAAEHHPLAGQLVRVVRRKRHEGAPHLVIEGPGGGRQLLPACHAEPAGTVPTAAARPLRFTPGGLRALSALVRGLRGAPSPAPEARHAPLPPEPAAPAATAVGHVPARDAPAADRPVGRPPATSPDGRPGAGAGARKAPP